MSSVHSPAPYDALAAGVAVDSTTKGSPSRRVPFSLGPASKNCLFLAVQCWILVGQELFRGSQRLRGQLRAEARSLIVAPLTDRFLLSAGPTRVLRLKLPQNVQRDGASCHSLGHGSQKPLLPLCDASGEVRRATPLISWGDRS